MTPTLRKSSILTIALLLGGLVHANLLVYEGFDYGGTTFNEGSGGSGWSGAWSITGGSPDVTAGYLSSSLTNAAFPFSTTGGAGFNDNGAFQPVRSFSTALNMDTNASYYFSFLINVGESSVNHIQFNGASSALIAGFREDGDGALTARAVGGNLTQNLSGTFGLNTTYFVAGVIEANSTGNDFIRFSVYSAANSVPASAPGSWTVSSSGAALTGSITGISILHTGTNNDGNRVIVDEFRLGSTWEAVAIPEPSTLALLGIALGAAVLTRRRK